MKSVVFRARPLVVAGAVFCLPVTNALAADTNAPPAGAPGQPVAAAPAAAPASAPAQRSVAPPAAPAAPAPAAPAPVATITASGRLPYGVEDVLKLTRAQMSEDVVLNYVLNSGTVYNLSPKDIIYLRNEGVSDRVITTMMNQKNHVAEENAAQLAAAQQIAAAQAAAAAPGYADPSLMAPAPAYPPAYIEPEPAPEPPPSTVYVIPYAGPFYRTYYPGFYYGPGVSVVYRFGRGGYYGYHRPYRYVVRR
jgi:hypothetical protein